MTTEHKPQNIPRVSVEDVGTYWTREDGSLWRVITYCEYPTVSWERVDGPPDVSTEPETVYVIPDYPHAWWRHEEVTEGCLVQLSDIFGRQGDNRIYRVSGIWDEGASLELVA